MYQYVCVYGVFGGGKLITLSGHSYSLIGASIRKILRFFILLTLAFRTYMASGLSSIQVNSDPPSLESYRGYLDHLSATKEDLLLVNTLYQRAVAHHCLDVGLWRDYLQFLVSWTGLYCTVGVRWFLLRLVFSSGLVDS